MILNAEEQAEIKAYILIEEAVRAMEVKGLIEISPVRPKDFDRWVVMVEDEYFGIYDLHKMTFVD